MFLVGESGVIVVISIVLNVYMYYSLYMHICFVNNHIVVEWLYNDVPCKILIMVLILL